MWWKRFNAGIDTQALGVVAHERYYLNPDASTDADAPNAHFGICCMALCGDIFPEHYHIGNS